MTIIYLDGQPVVASTKSIKLTSENPFFTKTSSYTYDVELPLDIPENRKIFGRIQRLDVAKNARTFDARLVIDAETRLAGKAHITSITDSVVKIQLLGDNAAYNYGNNMDETYIDELDLSDWFRTSWPDGSYYDARSKTWKYYTAEDDLSNETSDLVAWRAQYTNPPSTDYSESRLLRYMQTGFSNKWIAVPILNTSADMVCNGISYQCKYQQHGYDMRYRGYVGEQPSRRDLEGTAVVSFAIQPFVWLMAKKIAAATGFNLDDGDNALWTDTFFRRIFICNANNLLSCAKCLPHWSVNDWWTQIENTFGLVLGVDYEHKKITLHKRCDHYRADTSTQPITDVVDEYTVDVNDETQSDISTNNVGFADHDAAAEDILDDEIIEQAKINKSFASLAALLTWAKTQGAEAMANNKDTIWMCSDGRQYIYTDANGIVEINMFRPRKPEDKEDIDIELKFVPAAYTHDIDCEIYSASIPGTGADVRPSVIATFPVETLAAPNIAILDWYKNNDYVSLDIGAVIAGDAETQSTQDGIPDVIYLAIKPDNGKSTTDIAVDTTTTSGEKITETFAYPHPYLRERATAALDGEPTLSDTPYSLSLIPIAGQINLASQTLSQGVYIDTTTRYCAKFLTKHLPDIGCIFIIRGRKYVAEKFETDITSDGMSQLITGYFYPIELIEES